MANIGLIQRPSLASVDCPCIAQLEAVELARLGIRPDNETDALRLFPLRGVELHGNAGLALVDLNGGDGADAAIRKPRVFLLLRPAVASELHAVAGRKILCAGRRRQAVVGAEVAAPLVKGAGIRVQAVNLGIRHGEHEAALVRRRRKVQ